MHPMHDATGLLRALSGGGQAASGIGAAAALPPAPLPASFVAVSLASALNNDALFEDNKDDEPSEEEDKDDANSAIQVHDVTWTRVDHVHACAQLEKHQHRKGGRIRFDQINANAYLPGVGSDADAGKREWRTQNPFFYFFLMFPVAYVEQIVQYSNNSLAEKQKQLCAATLFKVIGILLAMTILGLPSRKHYWYNGIRSFASVDFSKFMSYSHFEHHLAHLRFGEGDEKADPWVRVRGFLNAINERRRQVLEPGTFVTVDESMVGWLGKGSWENGMPHVTKIIRKPTPVGAEVKNLACGDTGIMLFAELQEGKERMANKKYVDETKSAGTALVLRLTEGAGLHNSGCIVIGDSAFASVKTARALISRGMFFTGIVKTATRQFPITLLKGLSLQRGETATFTTTMDSHKYIAHAWHDSQRKFFISTCGRTTAGAPHMKRRVVADALTGETHTCVREVPRTELIADYFDHAPALDVHNHYRANLGLEEAWGTWRWECRVVCGLLGMVVTDAYLAYVRDCSDARIAPLPRYNFVTALADALINNTIQPERRVSGRFSHNVAPEPETKGICIPRALKEMKEREGLKCQRHQRECSKCSKKASNYCQTCSTESKIVVVCGTGTGRNCWTEHALQAQGNARQ